MIEVPTICVYGHRKHERVGDCFRGIALHTKGSFDLVYVEEPGTQPENVNRALRRAPGRYICLHDNDAEPLMDGWLDTLIQVLIDNPEIGLVGPFQLQHEPVLHRFQEHGIAICKEQFPQPFTRAYNIPTTCVVFDRERTPGLHFDESIPGTINGSDIDFCAQVHAQGFDVVLCSDVVYYHPEKTSFFDLCTDRGLASMNDMHRSISEQYHYVKNKWAREGDSAFKRKVALIDAIGPPEAHVCGYDCHPERFGKAKV